MGRLQIWLVNFLLLTFTYNNVCEAFPGTGRKYTPVVVTSPQSAYAGAVAQTGSGTVTWIDLNNAKVTDGAGAELWGLAQGDVAKELRLTGYGFNIPTGATIQGITATIRRKGDTTDGNKDLVIKLVKGGTLVGNNLADLTTLWPTTWTNKTYGSSSDLWGTTWTPTDINSTNFGISIELTYDFFAGAGWFYVDSVQISVYFTP